MNNEYPRAASLEINEDGTAEFNADSINSMLAGAETLGVDEKAVVLKEVLSYLKGASEKAETMEDITSIEELIEKGESIASTDNKDLLDEFDLARADAANAKIRVVAPTMKEAA